MGKSKFVTFILSGLPGLGHYYLGLRTRGLQMMSLFFGSIFILYFLRLDFAMPLVLPVVWFYSLFDALQQFNLINKEQTINDIPIIDLDTIKFHKYWVGIGLILLGAYLAFDNLFIGILEWEKYQIVRTIFTGLAFIILGIYLIKGNKSQENN